MLRIILVRVKKMIFENDLFFSLAFLSNEKRNLKAVERCIFLKVRIVAEL